DLALSGLKYSVVALVAEARGGERLEQLGAQLHGVLEQQLVKGRARHLEGVGEVFVAAVLEPEALLLEGLIHPEARAARCPVAGPVDLLQHAGFAEGVHAEGQQRLTDAEAREAVTLHDADTASLLA